MLGRSLATAAEATSTLALATWLGGLVALGAFAAPEVFGQLDREAAGALMGAIFRAFDVLVLVAAAVFAACELARVWDGPPGGVLGRLRGGAAAVVVVAGVASSAWLGPRIHEAFEAGVRRNVGAAGAVMERDHRLAEAAGKAAVTAGAAWLVLGVATRRKRL